MVCIKYRYIKKGVKKLDYLKKLVVGEPLLLMRRIDHYRICQLSFISLIISNAILFSKKSCENIM